MTKYSRSFAFIRGLFVLCASATLVPAQTTAEKRGKAVIDDAIKALGGEKFLNMQDRIESGRAYSFYREELSGLSIAKIYTRYLTVAPGKTGEELGVRERQAFGKNEESAVLLLETGGFEVSFRGSKAMQQERFDRYKDSTLRNIFYILRHRLREPGMIFESRGADVVDNVPVEIVEITDSQNRVVRVNFHQSTKLPVRQSYSRLDPKTRERNDEVSLFNRYRDTGGGVQWPHQILRERNGEKIYEIFSETVKIDTGLTDAVFNVPAPAPERKKK
jgi:hypothetical protein